MKRSVLERKTPLRSHSQLKRSPMKKRKGKLAKSREFTPEIRNIIHSRSGGLCERCYERPIVHLHHATFRSQGGNGTLSNAIGLCISCHDLCHSSRDVREWAVEMARELASGQTERA